MTSIASEAGSSRLIIGGLSEIQRIKDWMNWIGRLYSGCGEFLLVISIVSSLDYPRI